MIARGTRRCGPLLASAGAMALAYCAMPLKVMDLV